MPDSQFFPRHTTRLSLARFIDRLAILIQTHFEKASYVPVSTLSVFATVQPWEETVLGLLLVIGLATRFSLIAGGLVIMCLVFGTNLAQDWLVSGLQLIYAFLYYYLLVHLDQNRFSVDATRR